MTRRFTKDYAKEGLKLYDLATQSVWRGLLTLMVEHWEDRNEWDNSVLLLTSNLVQSTQDVLGKMVFCLSRLPCGEIWLIPVSYQNRNWILAKKRVSLTLNIVSGWNVLPATKAKNVNYLTKTLIKYSQKLTLKDNENYSRCHPLNFFFMIVSQWLKPMTKLYDAFYLSCQFLNLRWETDLSGEWSRTVRDIG